MSTKWNYITLPELCYCFTVMKLHYVNSIMLCYQNYAINILMKLHYVNGITLTELRYITLKEFFFVSY